MKLQKEKEENKQKKFKKLVKKNARQQVRMPKREEWHI